MTVCSCKHDSSTRMFIFTHIEGRFKNIYEEIIKNESMAFDKRCKSIQTAVQKKWPAFKRRACCFVVIQIETNGLTVLSINNV